MDIRAQKPLILDDSWIPGGPLEVSAQKIKVQEDRTMRRKISTQSSDPSVVSRVEIESLPPERWDASSQI